MSSSQHHSRETKVKFPSKKNSPAAHLIPPVSNPVQLLTAGVDRALQTVALLEEDSLHNVGPVEVLEGVRDGLGPSLVQQVDQGQVVGSEADALGVELGVLDRDLVPDLRLRAGSLREARQDAGPQYRGRHWRLGSQLKVGELTQAFQK